MATAEAPTLEPHLAAEKPRAEIIEDVTRFMIDAASGEELPEYPTNTRIHGVILV